MDRLLELQDVDSTVDRLSARRRVLESGEEVAAVRADADRVESIFGELRLSIDAIAREQRRLEHEIDSLTQKALAEERRLYDGSVANAKELASLQHEIENLKRRRGDREDELLGMMEERESLDQRAAEAERVARDRRALVDRAVADAAEELRRVGEELTGLGDRRASVLPGLDPELLELYEDLRRQKKGIGAVALVDGICQGCHEKLSSMEMDRLKRSDGIKRCEHCRRILVL